MKVLESLLESEDNHYYAPYDEGRLAVEDKTWVSNPYPNGSQENKEFDEGFNYALNKKDEQEAIENPHGWVTPRDDGIRMRCCGPNRCPVCKIELRNKNSKVAE